MWATWSKVFFDATLSIAETTMSAVSSGVLTRASNSVFTMSSLVPMATFCLLPQRMFRSKDGLLSLEDKGVHSPSHGGLWADALVDQLEPGGGCVVHVVMLEHVVRVWSVGGAQNSSMERRWPCAC